MADSINMNHVNQYRKFNQYDKDVQSIWTIQSTLKTASKLGVLGVV